MAFASVAPSAVFVLLTVFLTIWLTSRFVLPQLLSFVVSARASSSSPRGNNNGVPTLDLVPTVSSMDCGRRAYS